MSEASETTEQLLKAAEYLLGSGVELQKWSGLLDWSKRLVAEGVIRSPELVEAFSEVKRIDFLPESQKLDDGYDHPVSIGWKQTNSQPSLVANMLELLKPTPGQKILDVGSGSGWTTGLLGAVVGSEGQVIGTDRIKELVDFGKENLSPYGFSWVSVEHTDGGPLGFPEEEPYDRILVSAQMREEWLPELTDQLSASGGILVAPIAMPHKHGSRDYDQDIITVIKNGEELVTDTPVKGVSFVPLIHEPVHSD